MNDEPVMGRADILLRLLEKLKLNAPSSLERYLELVDSESKQPVTEQIIDLLLEEDPKRLGEYEEAKYEVGSANPYSSTEERAPQEAHLLGEFMKLWIATETRLREVITKKGYPANRPMELHSTILARTSLFSPSVIRDYEHLRYLRNMAVHGKITLSLNDLHIARQIVDELSAALDAADEHLERPQAANKESKP